MSSDERLRRAPRQPDVPEQVMRTTDWISQCNLIDQMRIDLRQKFDHLSIADINYIIATIVVENNLGADWYELHVEQGRRKNSTDAFLRRSPTTRMERRDHYARVMELGRRLFELMQEDFIDLLIDNLRTRDLAGALFEADVIRMLISLPVVIELRPALGVKGDDYDIDLWLEPDKPFAIEVKTRSEVAVYSDSALKTTLETARRQLPKSDMGAVFVKIPELWLGDEEYERRHPAVVRDYLRTTSRVQFVVLVSEEWTPETAGRGWSSEIGRRVYRSAKITDVGSLLIGSYENVWGTGIDILAPNAPF